MVFRIESIPGTEDMEKDCLNYGFHLIGGLKGQLIGLPAALLVGGFVALLGVVLLIKSI